MRQGALAFLIGVASLTTLMGGCPTLTTVTPLDPPPGSWFVERQDSDLYYYEFPQFAGDGGNWKLLIDAGEWYEQPAFYVYDGVNWGLDADRAELTLDDALQTYDPAPLASK
ncbi:MAG: hypothetical protein KDA32_11635 [Phycisphaerales bacterium]|nr:hypothetical protein [Phycisphaerales bacterium]